MRKNELKRILEKSQKTERKKTINNSLVKDIINNSEVTNNNKYYNTRYSSRKGSLKNIKNNIHFFWNQNKKNKELFQKYNSSQKNLFTPKKIDKRALNTSINSYRSLPKSKNNTNYLNKEFNFHNISNKKKINNYRLNSTFCVNPNNPIEKIFHPNKLYIDSRPNNRYLAPIIESNMAIENENSHFLEKTICGKNKIIKRPKNIKEICLTSRKNHNTIESNEKKNIKIYERRGKDRNLLTKTSKYNNKISFQEGIIKLNKKNQKNHDIKLKIKSNNIKVEKNNNHHIVQETNKKYKNNINTNNTQDMNQTHIDNVIITDFNYRNKQKSKKKRYFNRAESIDINMNNLSTLQNNHLFSGKIEDYLITKELGKGCNAIVKLAMHKITKEKYAIKIYTKQSLLDPQKRNTVKNEINILKQLNHKNIMKLYEVIDTSKYLYLVLEYIKGISLLDVIKKEKCHYIEQNRALKLFLQIVKAISYCQSKNINHRDIKLENILVQNDDTIKLIDFGFAVKGNKETYQKLFCGTPSYMPPEIVNKEKYIAQYSDIWSLGVLLYTMLYGRFPFRAKDDDKLFSLINSGNIEFPEYIPVNECIKNLIKKIINFNPKLRPSPEEIICEIIFNE